MTSSDAIVRLDAILKTAIDGIITLDDNGIIEIINTAALNLFGYEADELIGQNINKLMLYPDQSEYDNYMQAYAENRPPNIIGFGRVSKGVKKNGQIFLFRLAINKVTLSDRSIFTAIIHDLSGGNMDERKLIEVNNNLETQIENRTQDIEDILNVLLKTNRKLEESQLETINALQKEKNLNELKSRFVSMASHEFRTPLSTILSSASLIEKYTNISPNTNIEKHVNRIKSSVQNLTIILDDFMSIGKLEEGRIEIVLKEVDLEELCNDVNAEIINLFKEDQTICKTTEGLPRPILTDPRILKNIMINLVSNAIKYSKIAGRIECKTSYNEDSFSISYIDNGIGIPEADQKHLFERFFRATNVENIQGTGLGLNIVRRYIDLLGGNISFTSTEGIGTTFTVSLSN